MNQQQKTKCTSYEAIERNPRAAMTALLVLAILLRFAYGIATASIPWNDSDIYRASASQLYENGRIASDIVMPLYPAFLGMVGWSNVLTWQVLLSAACVPLVYLLAQQIYKSKRLAWAAAALMCIEPLSIYYSNQRLTETFYTFLLLVSLLLFSKSKYALASIVFVAANLTRPSLDFAGPLIVVAFCWANETRPSLRFVLSRLAVYSAIYLAMMAPWWLHNYQKYGEFVRLNLGSGIVFRVENNSYFERYGFWKDLQPIFNEFNSISDPIARDNAYKNAALEYVSEDPLRYAWMSLKRLFRFYSPVIDQSEVFASGSTRWMAFPGSLLIILLSCVFILLPKPASEIRSLGPVLLTVVCLTLVHMMVHGIVRYRTPLMPLLAILGASALMKLETWWRSRTSGPGAMGATLP